MADAARSFTFADLDPDAPASLAAVAEPVDPIDDALTALVSDDTETVAAAALDLDRLRRLKALRQKKSLHEAAAKALGADIAKLNAEVVEHVAEVTEADFRRKWQCTVDDATAWARVADYPKYRTPEGAEKAYTMDDLLPRLRECSVPGFAELVKETVNGNAWNGAIRRLVEAWRERVDETGGPVNAEGEPVDAFGNVLTADEREDPTADELGLPPEIREIVSISTTIDLMFRQK